MSNSKTLFLNVSIPAEARVPNGERRGRRRGKGPFSRGEEQKMEKLQIFIQDQGLCGDS